MKFIGPSLLALCLICCCASLQATPFYYSDEAEASGSLGSSTFTNALVTATFFGDTTNVSPVGSDYLNTVGAAFVTVAGLGTATFTDSVIAFDVQGGLVAGIYDATVSNEILDTQNSAFATYDLTTPIGPISGTANVPVALSFETNMGALVFTSIGRTSTFSAGEVPEPLTSTLTCSGLVLIAILRLRQRARLAKQRA